MLKKDILIKNYIQMIVLNVQRYIIKDNNILGWNKIGTEETIKVCPTEFWYFCIITITAHVIFGNAYYQHIYKEAQSNIFYNNLVGDLKATQKYLFFRSTEEFHALLIGKERSSVLATTLRDNNVNKIKTEIQISSILYHTTNYVD